MTDVEGFDMLYLIVSPKNPLKDGISSNTATERYSAALDAVARHPDLKVKVDDIELQMPEPHYTIRTLDALRTREPSHEFTLIIGADNLACIRSWRDYRRILCEYGVCVFPRTGFDLEVIKADLLAEDPSYKITVSEAEMVDISSTIIRNAIASGMDASEWLM
jgi:nicotinate-nucleotide adenylyltransferase